MGVYRSQPIREKDSVDDEGPTMCYGASSMQGWRMTQEDAHNCCLDYDKEKNMSLFAVYDGHGGSEVAEYTAINFPDFIKNMPDFKEGKLSQALEDAFLEFDEKLTKPEIIKQLKELAGVEDEQCEAEREQEVKGLYEEADMPLEQLLQRYQPGVKSLRELRKNEIRKNEPSPALKAKKEKALTEGNGDIKENLEEKLVNGEGDCNGDHMVSDKASSTRENTENSSDTKEQGGGEVNAKAGQGDGGLDVKGEVTEAQIGGPDCPEEGTTKEEAVVCSQSECSEAAASGTTDTNAKSDSSITTQDNKNNAAEALPDSTQKESTPDKAAKESEQIPKRETNGETEVSSSSEGSVSQVKVGGGGSSIGSVSASSSSSCETSMTVTGEGSVNPSSSGESGGSGSAQGSDPSSGSSSTYSAVADSSSKAEPCSSSGRTRSGRKNIIPEEGEDESSFDEEEETTDDDDSEEDVADFVEEDSEDDSEDDQLEEGEVDEEVEGEEEGGVAYSMEPGSDSGCTAVVALLRGRELYVANAGDSRCVVCREGKAVDMSFDHKPEDMVELKRILNAGGQVTPDGRVNGGLNLSRAIGDHAYKKNTELPLKDQMISSLPDIRCITLDEKDEFMVLACDGIWNSLSSQDTVTFVKDRLKGGTTSLSTICEELFECCLAPNTCGDGSGCDNMTCIIVKFKEELLKLHTAGDSVKRRASSDADSSQTDPKKQKEGD